MFLYIFKFAFPITNLTRRAVPIHLRYNIPTVPKFQFRMCKIVLVLYSWNNVAGNVTLNNE
jgi:hypothetical protein